MGNEFENISLKSKPDKNKKSFRPKNNSSTWSYFNKARNIIPDSKYKNIEGKIKKFLESNIGFVLDSVQMLPKQLRKSFIDQLQKEMPLEVFKYIIEDKAHLHSSRSPCVFTYKFKNTGEINLFLNGVQVEYKTDISKFKGHGFIKGGYNWNTKDLSLALGVSFEF